MVALTRWQQQEWREGSRLYTGGRTARPGNDQMQGWREGPQGFPCSFWLGTLGGWMLVSLIDPRSSGGAAARDSKRYVSLKTYTAGKWSYQHWTKGPGDENVKDLSSQRTDET